MASGLNLPPTFATGAAGLTDSPEAVGHPQPLAMDPGTEGRSLASGCTPDPARWRLEPTLALLLPPHDGLTAARALETTPGVFASRVQCDRWLGQLAGRVRAGELSPEAALLAACIYGETRRPDPLPVS